MEEDNVLDPWDNQPHYNFDGPVEPPKKKFTSSMEKQAKGKLNKESADRLAKALEKLMAQNGEPGVVTLPKPVTALTMADRYKQAWGTAYKKQSEFRRKEIDNQLKTGKLTDSSWDTDFAQQVISLAESGDPPEI